MWGIFIRRWVFLVICFWWLETGINFWGNRFRWIRILVKLVLYFILGVYLTRCFYQTCPSNSFLGAKCINTRNDRRRQKQKNGLSKFEKKTLTEISRKREKVTTLSTGIMRWGWFCCKSKSFVAFSRKLLFSVLARHYPTDRFDII